MTASLTPKLDARHAAELGDDFTEEQMTAIDRAVVKVYVKARAILPPVLLGAGKGDPAAALRAVAYEYALTHRRDIDTRTDWQITHHVAGRLQQYVTRAVKARMERPYGIGDEFSRTVTAKLREVEESTGVHKPRRYPARYWQNPSPYESDIQLDMFDLYGCVIPEDKMQFIRTGTRNGKPVFMEPDVFAKLHTRKPTPMEFWEQVCTERDRREFREQLAQTFAAGICSCKECTTP